MIRHLPSLALAVIFLGGCTAEQPAAPKDPEQLPPQSFRRDWAAQLNLKNDQVERLFVKDDVVIAYTKKQEAYIINRTGGFIRFTATMTDSPIRTHEPVVLKEKIIFPTNSTLEVYRRDGRFERSFETNNSLRTNAVGWPNGTRVYFGVDTPGAGRMVAVDTLPGQYKPINQKWELMSTRGAAINSAPAVHAGVVYVAFDDGDVYAVNGDTRESIWSTSTGPTFKTYGPVQADLRADEFGVYVPSTDTKFYCLDRTQGRVKWSYFGGTSLRRTPDVTATMVYLPVEGKIVAIDKLNGSPVREPKWSVNDMIKLVSEDDKHAYFQRKDNIVVAIDKASGEQKFTSKRKDLVAFATNTKDATIFASTSDGTVYSITPVLKAGQVGEIAMDDVKVIHASEIGE